VGKPGRRLRPGSRFIIEGHPSNSLTLEVLEAAEEDIRIVRLSTEEGLDTVGHIPLPPYIHTPLDDGERYQTVYSRAPGSVAAPTAGLHFTPELLESLAVKGVQQVYATLHVGLDTFRPIRSEAPEEHKLHGEYFELSEDGAARLNAARREGRRIIAVGTTSVRLLEQAALLSDKAGALAGTPVSPIEDRHRELLPTSGWADLYILPGHRFRVVDAMITNFHLPRTTLLMLVSALAGRELILKAYREAVSEEYRFYSFGDGMLIL
jgi:S-adenosylmethionine:tRNA ribosyltransferase-isomerase